MELISIWMAGMSIGFAFLCAVVSKHSAHNEDKFEYIIKCLEERGVPPMRRGEGYGKRKKVTASSNGMA
jgi:hypothetical protein